VLEPGEAVSGLQDAGQCMVKCMQLQASFQIGDLEAGMLAGQDPEAGE